MSAARRERRPRAARSLTARLAAIVLAFESIVVFLGGLAIYGLDATPAEIAPWWGVVAGSVMAVAMILVSGRTHTRGGIVAGWVLQAVVALAGILVPAMLIVALVFGGMWAYAVIQGPRLEQRGATAPEGE